MSDYTLEKIYAIGLLKVYITKEQFTYHKVHNCACNEIKHNTSIFAINDFTSNAFSDILTCLFYNTIPSF